MPCTKTLGSAHRQPAGRGRLYLRHCPTLHPTIPLHPCASYPVRTAWRSRTPSRSGSSPRWSPSPRCLGAPWPAPRSGIAPRSRPPPPLRRAGCCLLPAACCTVQLEGVVPCALDACRTLLLPHSRGLGSATQPSWSDRSIARHAWPLVRVKRRQCCSASSLALAGSSSAATHIHHESLLQAAAALHRRAQRPDRHSPVDGAPLGGLLRSMRALLWVGAARAALPLTHAAVAYQPLAEGGA